MTGLRPAWKSASRRSACQQVLAEAGTRINRLVAVGGGSNSSLWLDIIAANLNAELLVPQDGDFGGAFGAARLGRCAATGADPAEIMTLPPIARTVRPDPALADAYQKSYARYRALYPAIKGAIQ
jgi:xylulokinase